MKFFTNIIKVIVIFLTILSINRISFEMNNGTVYNDNYNKTIDLTAMSVKLEEIRMKDLFYPLDTYVGDMTAYVADCPLCTGYLGCNNQNVLDGTTIYNDDQYGAVRIVASSKNLKCGSIISFDYDGVETLGIVLDRGVLGTDIDLLVNDLDYAYKFGRRNISYDILRFGWSRSNS